MDLFCTLAFKKSVYQEGQQLLVRGTLAVGRVGAGSILGFSIDKHLY